MAKQSITIRARQYGGTYIATGGGKTASCTSGFHDAVRVLCNKLFRLPSEVETKFKGQYTYGKNGECGLEYVATGEALESGRAS